MKFFNASFTTVILRFYLLMLVCIVPFFIGAPVLAILALPIFLLTITGTSIERPTSKTADVHKNVPNRITSKDVNRANEKLAY